MVQTSIIPQSKLHIRYAQYHVSALCGDGSYSPRRAVEKVIWNTFYIYQTLLSKATYSTFGLHFLSVHVFPGNQTHNLCAANAMLYHWAKVAMFNSIG